MKIHEIFICFFNQPFYFHFHRNKYIIQSRTSVKNLSMTFIQLRKANGRKWKRFMDLFLEYLLNSGDNILHLGWGIYISASVDFGMETSSILQFNFKFPRDPRNFVTDDFNFSSKAAFQFSFHFAEFWLVASSTTGNTNKQ